MEIQADLGPKAAKAKVDDFIDLRFVDEIRESGFPARLSVEPHGLTAVAPVHTLRRAEPSDLRRP